MKPLQIRRDTKVDVVPMSKLYAMKAFLAFNDAFTRVSSSRATLADIRGLNRF